MAEQVSTNESLKIEIVCHDGSAIFHHEPGPFAWRWMVSLLCSEMQEAASKKVDLSEYFAVRHVELLNVIFSQTHGPHIKVAIPLPIGATSNTKCMVKHIQLHHFPH